MSILLGAQTMKRFGTVLFIFFCAFASYKGQAQDEPLLVYYEPSIPYFYTPTRELSGTYYRLGNRIFQQAGYKPRWLEATGQRIVTVLKSEEHRACTIGYRRLPERIGVYQFTKPVAQAEHNVLVIKKEMAEKARALGSFKAIMEDQSLVGGFIGNTTYTAEHQALIDKYKSNHVIVPTFKFGLMRLILLGRIDFTMAGSEDVDFITKSDVNNQLTIVEVPDLVGERLHYVMCSKAITDDEISEINQSIDQVVGTIE